MNLEEDILIERFLKNELSKEEKQSFVERMDADASFKEKVTLEKQLFESFDESSWSFLEEKNHPEVQEFEVLFRSDKTQQLKDAIVQSQNKYKASQTTTKKKKWIVYPVAVVILIFFSIVLFFPQKSNEKLFASYLQKTDLLTLVDRASKDSTLSKVREFFDAQKYLQVTEILKNSIDTTRNSTIYIYLAISQMELEKFIQSEETLNQLIQSNLPDAQKGYWYKSLLYLKSGQLEKSKEELKNIIDNSYYKHKEARELLREIK